MKPTAQASWPISAVQPHRTNHRRGFLAGAGAAAGAFTFGFSFPLSTPAVAQAQAPEVNAWVVVQPDDSVIIRIARAEMGQGSLTGLAQLVAEELECDWDRVRFELVKPGEHRRRNRVWRDLSTGGSRAIRGSQDYVRMGRCRGAHDAGAGGREWLGCEAGGMRCR